MADERIEVARTIDGPPAAIFALLCEPAGHVAIDASGMLTGATGRTVGAVGDSFVVHMDREALNDYPLGRYDVTVTITTYEQDRELAWDIRGEGRSPIGHVYGYRLAPEGASASLVTSYYDWSGIRESWRDRGSFPVIAEPTLRATLGILARTVAPQNGSRVPT